MIVATVAATTLRRVARDRTGLFFMVLLPLLIIVLVGSSVSEADRVAVGVVDEGGGPLATELVDDLRQADSIEVRTFDDEDALRLALRRSELMAGVVIPASVEDEAAATRTVTVLSPPASTTGLAAEQAVRAALGRRAVVMTAAAFAADEAGGEPADHLAVAAALAEEAPPLQVRTSVGGESRTLPLGFSYSSSTMLVLFVFVNAVAGGATIVQNRQLGLYERMLAAPVSAGGVIAGETASYLLLALLQSLVIVGIGAVLFQVSWGDPLAAAALVVVWAAVGASAGMLAGTLARTPDQATSIGPMVGIAFGMLGGCMWPLEIVPPIMQTIGHLVPHGWAVDAWIELLSHDGGIGDVARHLAVLAGFAAVFGVVAGARLRRRLVA